MKIKTIALRKKPKIFLRNDPKHHGTTIDNVTLFSLFVRSKKNLRHDFYAF